MVARVKAEPPHILLLGAGVLDVKVIPFDGLADLAYLEVLRYERVISGLHLLM